MAELVVGLCCKTVIRSKSVLSDSVAELSARLKHCTKHRQLKQVDRKVKTI